MINIDSESFLFVVLAAALAAFVAGLVSTRLTLPVVVLEVLLGILIGPDVLGLADPDAFLGFFSNLGLGMLFFFAGYEIDFERIRGNPLRLAVLGWLLSLVLAADLFPRGLAPVDAGAPDKLRAAACTGCHVTVHAEWAQSRHGLAWTNAIFQREYRDRPLE